MSKAKYTNKVSQIPFTLDAVKYDKDSLIIFKHSLFKIKRHERHLNKAIAILERNGWLDKISICQASENNGDITFSINNNHPQFNDSTRIQLLSPLFTFNLITGKTKMHDFFMNTRILIEYFATVIKKKETLVTATQYYIDNGFQLEDAIGVMELNYSLQEELVTSKHPEVFYDQVMFLKTVVLHMIASKRRSHYYVPQTSILMGNPEDWLPYVLKDIHIENLIYSLSAEIVTNKKSSETLTLQQIHHTAWSGSYPYSPEELEPFGQLPREWYKMIWTVSPIKY